MEYDKAVYRHPAYLTYMQSISCEMLGWTEHKLKSRLPGETSIVHLIIKGKFEGFPGGSDSKEFTCNAGDKHLISGSGITLAEGNGCPLQYSCLENPMDRGAWQPTYSP